MYHSHWDLLDRAEAVQNEPCDVTLAASVNLMIVIIVVMLFIKINKGEKGY